MKGTELLSARSEQILKEALALTAEERAELVERLLATFQLPPNSQLDDLWAREAEDRIEAFERGELKAVSADEVFQRLRQRRAKLG